MNDNVSITELDAYVLKVTKDVVICECVLDKKNAVYETRKFNSLLFEHINPLEDRHPIRINITSQPGTTTINIIDGKGIVDMSAFDIDWNDPEFLDACRHLTIEGWHQQLEGEYMVGKMKEVYYFTNNVSDTENLVIEDYIQEFEKKYNKKIKYRVINSTIYISYVDTVVDEKFDKNTNFILHENPVNIMDGEPTSSYINQDK